MRSTPRSSFSSFKLKTLSAAVISAVVLSNAHAAGLGKLTVLSSLGQPLRAEIELTSVSPDEAGSLIPKLASADAFRQANIDLNPALFSLRFAVEQRGNRPIVRITSTQPINEPFVDMLLELAGNKNRLVREYTFLLDPPEMRSARAVQVAPIVVGRALPPVTPVERNPESVTPSSEPAAQSAPAARETAVPSAASKPARAVPEPKADAAAADEYQVKKGDTLAKIANQYRPSGVSLDQMLVSLYRANPDAFIGKNMNRLRAGQILSVPEADSAKSVAQSEAKGVVVAQAADFNSYRNKLAGQVAAAEAKKSDDVRQTAGGKITTRIQEESGAGDDSKDKLKLSKSGAAANAGANAGASAEDLIAKDRAIAEANARVKELEKNVSELQKILEIKNKDLAEQQKAASATSAAPVAAVVPAAASPAVETPTAATPADAAATAAPAEAVVATEAAVAPVPVTEPAPTPKPAPKKPVVVAPPPPPPSFFEDLMDNALFLPGAAALLALLAGLGIYSSRRRKQTKSFEDSIISDSSLKSNSLFGSTGGQSVDTNNSVFNSNFVPSASQLDTNEVDPIAEADVYIAYGRDAQAEEILKEALRNQPDRHAVRVKLLEIYANRNDARSFEILASELYSLTKGEGEDWKQAANMGLILDPSNPLYANNTLMGKTESNAAALNAHTQPFDEEDTATSSEPAESDTSFASSSLADSPTLPLNEEWSQKPADAPVQQAVIEDLDFDLDGLDTENTDKKSSETSSTEMPTDIADIDFGFLEDQSASATGEKPAVASFEARQETSQFAAPEILIPDDLGLDFPSKNSASVQVAATPAKEPTFDLSDIALDLHPADAVAANDLALDGLDDDTSYTSNAEMATKLDLAIAYQEIGDKEGARELLEEVVKGGNGEQSERAKNLLSKLS
ncbi:FimV/HubP family polar landmark protein [Herminiimonas sp. NPDC097707]|uniref:FimV/HubP family polar landmark protein n=1 Tax=Herminiimonas sp. NPDC097707 TaxID=3364007 RepID=UPI00383B9D64